MGQLMEDTTSDSAEQDAADACHECGSPNVQHRSLLRSDGDDDNGTIVMLCDDCHRARLAR
jgi:hypothetical protein